MAPLEITIKASPSDTFKVEVDDEETVEDLSVIVMSLRPDLGEELRLLHKGKFLKDHEVVKALGIQPTDFVAVVGKKKPEPAAPAPTAYTPATVAAAAAAALAAPASPAEDDEAADLAAALAMSQNPGAMAAPAAPPVAPSGQVVAGPDETMVANLCGMGFDRAMVIQALQAAFGNPDRAVEYLFNGIPAMETAAPQQEEQPATFTGGDMQAVLGPQLLTKSGMMPTAQALKDVDVVMLYFSAHWCPPCRAFTPKLTSAFKYGSPPPNLACVFISADRDEMAFTQYYNEMPWLAIPFASAGAKSQSLGPAFNVQGIPSLVVLNAKTGAPITLNGRDEVASMGFNLGACMQRWSQGPAPAAAVAAPTPDPLVAQGITIPEEHKKAKKEEPDPGPPPLPIDDAAAKAALGRVLKESWEVQDTFFKTGLKVLNNILSNPAEQKFRTLKRTNAALKAKLLDVGENAGTDLMVLAGFGISSDEALSMGSEPDGRCSEVRNRLKSTHYSAWEQQARKERDERIKTEMEKDKKSGARTMGGEGVSGRNTYGADRRGGGGRGGGGG